MCFRESTRGPPARTTSGMTMKTQTPARLVMLGTWTVSNWPTVDERQLPAISRSRLPACPTGGCITATSKHSLSRFRPVPILPPRVSLPQRLCDSFSPKSLPVPISCVTIPCGSQACVGVSFVHWPAGSQHRRDNWLERLTRISMQYRP